MQAPDMVKALASDDGEADRLSEPGTEGSFSYLFPLRFLGIGLWIAWLCCTHVSTIFPGAGVSPETRDVVDFTMRYADIGTFLLLALFFSKIGSLSRHPVACTIAVFLTSAGTAFLGLILLPSGSSELFIRGVSLITAVGGAFLFCLWGEVYSQLGPVRVIAYGAVSCIAAFLVYFIINALMPPYAIAATSLLPLLSLACVFLSFQIVPRESQRPSNIRYPIPWKLFLLMAIAGLLSGLSGVFLDYRGGIGAIHRIQVTGLAGITILVMLFIFRERCDVRFLAKVCLPIAIIAFAIIPFAGPMWGYAVSFLIKFAYVWFTFFVLIMLANIVYRFELPSLRLFAIARAVSEGAILFGVAFRDPIRSSGLLQNPAFLYGTTIAGLLLMMLCVFIWMREKSVNADWGAAGINIESGIHVAGPRERIMQQCDVLAQEHDLTGREKEILALIAQGKSRADIGQELFLSQNTIKTHSRNLYAKLNVHSKEEVFDLFGL